MDPARLTAIPIFSELSAEEARRLAAFASETSVSAGRYLMREGDFSTKLIAIEDGTADVIRGGVTIASLGPGDVIGEMGLLEHRPRSADVVARSPMLLIELTHWEIRRMSDATVARLHETIERRRQAGVADPGHEAEPTA
ncbi:MAG: cyclic nucleotide-binding domain-containing protein [Solirubrobacteraceae bacterium]